MFQGPYMVVRMTPYNSVELCHLKGGVYTERPVHLSRIKHLANFDAALYFAMLNNDVNTAPLKDMILQFDRQGPRLDESFTRRYNTRSVQEPVG